MKENGVSGTTKGGRVSGSEKVILHHQKQNPNGPIIELPKSKHDLGNKKMHPFGNKKGAGVGKNRPDFDNWRKEYWKNRADVELNKKKISFH
nr:HNH/ENDO VII family nuclease [Cellulophaga lytica]